MSYKAQMMKQFCDLLKNHTEEEIKAAMGAPAAPLQKKINTAIIKNSVPPAKKVNSLKVTGFTPAKPAIVNQAKPMTVIELAIARAR